MAINHNQMRLAVASIVGLLAAYASYNWLTDTDRPARREEEEAVVMVSRDILREYVGAEDIEISDALNREKSAGKVYIFPAAAGWELSGHYRRSGEDNWHDYLMVLDNQDSLVNLRVNDDDTDLRTKAAQDPKLQITK